MTVPQAVIVVNIEPNSSLPMGNPQPPGTLFFLCASIITVLCYQTAPKHPPPLRLSPIIMPFVLFNLIYICGSVEKKKSLQVCYFLGQIVFKERDQLLKVAPGIQFCNVITVNSGWGILDKKGSRIYILANINY